ncbi:transmembrane protein 207 isoform X1 [Mustela nigripes]|uniref:transmembrane protein 207 isoform X1 n=1 Tax=Mustela nigripes TaxID=77151 RepID=UPI0028167FA9|nr:transmembrane protein 207 isoform X1 [Mustela nigripes]
MLGPRPFSFTSVISKAGTSCLPLFQLVLSDPPCEENEMCINYKDRYTRDWYIWFLLLIFLMTLLCGVMFFCLQCWLRRPRMESPSRTMAVFAVGDLDPVYGYKKYGRSTSPGRETVREVHGGAGIIMGFLCVFFLIPFYFKQIKLFQ